MAVDDQEEVVTVEKCEFDGDWQKAMALDVAFTYAITTVDEYRHKIKSEVRGRTPINATYDFTLITTIFQEVLNQKGYAVLDAEDLGKLDDGATKLLKKLAEKEVTIEQLTNRVEYLEGLIDRRDEATWLLSERDKEIRSLREQLAVLQPQPSELDKFKASECAGDYPYNPSNGMPCVFKSSDPGHPGSPHESEGGGQWWDHHGENEAAARALQQNKPAELDFKASRCDREGPYNPKDGAPCIIPDTKHPAGQHVDMKAVRWLTEDGLAEAVARQQQARARTQQT